MKKKSIILFAMIIAIVTIFAVVFTACNGLKGIVDGLNKETYTDQTKSLSEVEEALGSKYYIKYKMFCYIQYNLILLLVLCLIYKMKEIS